mgnify:CR=1 FL=1
MAPGRRPYIFVVGFNRCGTRLIHNRLRELGIASVHWQQGAIARQLLANYDAGFSRLNSAP